MKKIILILLTFIFSLAASAQDKAGKISFSDNKQVIFKHSQFVGGDTHKYWKQNIPEVAKDHCRSIKKNTYKFYGDNFHSAGVTSMLVPVGSAFYRYICAEDIDDAIEIRSQIIKEKNSFNKGALHWKEKNEKVFYWNKIALKDEWFVSDRIKKERMIAKQKEQEKIKLKWQKRAEFRKKMEKDKQERLANLEKQYGSSCSGIFSFFKHEKGTPGYEKCLYSEARKDLERKKIAQQEKEKKIREQKERTLLAQRAEINKISNFTPEQKRAYDCEKTFGFRKGSGDFKDCIFKLYTISAELEKAELQAQLKKLEMDNERQRQIIAQNRSNQQAYANSNAVADAMREANSIARGKALLEYSRMLNNRQRRNTTNCMITRHGIHSILNCR